MSTEDWLKKVRTTEYLAKQKKINTRKLYPHFID